MGRGKQYCAGRVICEAEEEGVTPLVLDTINFNPEGLPGKARNQARIEPALAAGIGVCGLKRGKLQCPPRPNIKEGRGYSCGQDSPLRVLQPRLTPRLTPPISATEPDAANRTNPVKGVA